MKKIYRLHYRAQLKEDYREEDLQTAIRLCIENVQILQKNGKLLTVALYYCERMLFLYYEAIGESVKVVEPIVVGKKVHMRKAAEGKTTEIVQNGQNCGNANSDMANIQLESGEDVQATVVHPNDFLVPLSTYLMVWPGQKADRLWVHMYHIYYHSIPKSLVEWKRVTVPEKRQGRIAFLREEKVFSYIYYHKAIVDEGLLLGDKYQSIALHENILFSYFEEPKTQVNIRNCAEESKVISEWIKENPKSHFIHMPEAEGENFMLLPALFALGIEDFVEV